MNAQNATLPFRPTGLTYSVQLSLPLPDPDAEVTTCPDIAATLLLCPDRSTGRTTGKFLVSLMASGSASRRP